MEGESSIPEGRSMRQGQGTLLTTGKLHGIGDRPSGDFKVLWDQILFDAKTSLVFNRKWGVPQKSTEKATALLWEAL